MAQETLIYDTIATGGLPVYLVIAQPGAFARLSGSAPRMWLVAAGTRTGAIRRARGAEDWTDWTFSASKARVLQPAPPVGGTPIEVRDTTGMLPGDPQ